MKGYRQHWAVMLLAMGTASLTGCLVPTPLVIADLETDKVVIQADQSESDAAVLGKAREGCAIHDRTPLALSTLEVCGTVSCYEIGTSIFCGQSNCWNEHLFACVE